MAFIRLLKARAAGVQSKYRKLKGLDLGGLLPKKDGLSLLKDLREMKNTTPVLMLTAKDSVEDTVAGLDSGSDGYLTKPFAFTELLAKVRALGRRGAQERGAEIIFADLRLNANPLLSVNGFA